VGRKRHLLVDTDGLILKVRVHAASLQDRDGAALVLDQIDETLSELELIWADAAYAGAKFQNWMQARFGACPLRLEIVRRSDSQTGFAVPPRHWVVERTFGWPISSAASPRTTSFVPTPPKPLSSWLPHVSSSLVSHALETFGTPSQRVAGFFCLFHLSSGTEQIDDREDRKRAVTDQGEDVSKRSSQMCAISASSEDAVFTFD